MKTLVSILLLFSVTFASAQQSISPKVQYFLEEFEEIAVKHDYKRILKFMDPEYQKERPDEMIGRSAVNFIDGFFAGYSYDDPEYLIEAPLYEILSIELVSVKKATDEEYKVEYKIGLHNNEYIRSEWTLKVPPRKKMGFIGDYS